MCPVWNVRSPHSASSWRHDPFPWLFAELHPRPPMQCFPNSRICYLQVRGFFSVRRPEKSGTPVCGSTPRRSTPVPLAGILQSSLRNTPVLPTGYCGTPPGYCGQAVLWCGQPLKTLRNVLRNVRFCLSCARSFIYGTEKCSKPSVAIVRCLQRQNRSGANGLPAFRHFCFRTFICCQEKPIS